MASAGQVGPPDEVGAGHFLSDGCNDFRGDGAEFPVPTAGSGFENGHGASWLHLLWLMVMPAAASMMVREQASQPTLSAYHLAAGYMKRSVDAFQRHGAQ